MYYFQLRVSTLKLLFLKKIEWKQLSFGQDLRTSTNAHQQLSTRAKTLPDSTPYLNPLVAKDIKKLLYPGQDTTGLLHQNSDKQAQKSPFIESNNAFAFHVSEELFASSIHIPNVRTMLNNIKVMGLTLEDNQFYSNWSQKAKVIKNKNSALKKFKITQERREVNTEQKKQKWP